MYWQMEHKEYDLPMCDLNSTVNDHDSFEEWVHNYFCEISEMWPWEERNKDMLEYWVNCEWFELNVALKCMSKVVSHDTLTAYQCCNASNARYFKDKWKVISYSIQKSM